mmetsp:Transcript_21832/g.88912  ORF Transcript_21832/g.88912 Transcript_21832/m.88912 type:complete len:180 (-) Transcript_21832:1611-2150(-)
MVLLGMTLGFVASHGASLGRRGRAQCGANLNLNVPNLLLPDGIHSSVGRWKCVKNCGACCFLDPDFREPLEPILSTEDFALYMSMVGPDGWCIHFNKTTRTCGNYENRPMFCRVTKEQQAKIYGLSDEDGDLAAVESCMDHIQEVYGPESKEMRTYADAVGVDLEIEDREDELGTWVEL